VLKKKKKGNRECKME